MTDEGQEKKYETKGRHVIADFWGVDFKILDNIKFLRELCKVAAEKSGATVLKVVDYKFKPQGCTIAILLSESHLTLHSYPLEGYCMLDIATCGDDVDPTKSIMYLNEVLQPKDEVSILVKRGLGANIQFEIQY